MVCRDIQTEDKPPAPGIPTPVGFPIIREVPTVRRPGATEFLEPVMIRCELAVNFMHNTQTMITTHQRYLNEQDVPFIAPY